MKKETIGFFTSECDKRNTFHINKHGELISSNADAAVSAVVKTPVINGMSMKLTSFDKAVYDTLCYLKANSPIPTEIPLDDIVNRLIETGHYCDDTEPVDSGIVKVLNLIPLKSIERPDCNINQLNFYNQVMASIRKCTLTRISVSFYGNKTIRAVEGSLLTCSCVLVEILNTPIHTYLYLNLNTLIDDETRHEYHIFENYLRFIER